MSGNKYSVTCPKCSCFLCHRADETNETAVCKKCGHSFKWHERMVEELTKFVNSLGRFDPKPEIVGVFGSRDVYVNGPTAGLSADSNPIGPVRVGRLSSENRVINNQGLIMGKMTSTGHLAGQWW